VVDANDGTVLGEADAVELVTLGQRRGVGLPGGGPKRYVVGIDVQSATVTVGDESMLDVHTTAVGAVSWAHRPVEGEVQVQCSAHGEARPATITGTDGGGVRVQWHQPQRRVAPGQSVVFYDPTNTHVLGGAPAL
jgi:tRNA-specific 2-thiouridylase